jgi:hypothetical protein
VSASATADAISKTDLMPQRAAYIPKLVTTLRGYTREQFLRDLILIEEIGEEHLCPTLDAALARAREELELRNVLGGTTRRDAVA